MYTCTRTVGDRLELTLHVGFASHSDGKILVRSDDTSEGYSVLSKGKIIPFNGGGKLYVSNRKRTDSGSPSTSNEG